MKKIVSHVIAFLAGIAVTVQHYLPAVERAVKGILRALRIG